MKPFPVTKPTGKAPAIRGAYAALFLTIAVVIMRSWARIGLMTYIPFYDIDFLKGEPIYAGTLVSVLLLGRVGVPLVARCLRAGGATNLI